jgi:hypothetical protein
LALENNGSIVSRTSLSTPLAAPEFVLTADGSGGTDISVRAIPPAEFDGMRPPTFWGATRKACSTVLWPMNGTQVTSTSVVGGDPNWRIVGIGDFYGTGTADLLWTNPQSAP